MIQKLVLPGNAGITRESVYRWNITQDGKTSAVFGRYISKQDCSTILNAYNLGITDYTRVFADNNIREYSGKDGAFIYFNKKRNIIKEIKSIQRVIEDSDETGPTEKEEENSPEGELAELVRQLEQTGR